MVVQVYVLLTWSPTICKDFVPSAEGKDSLQRGELRAVEGCWDDATRDALRSAKGSNESILPRVVAICFCHSLAGQAGLLEEDYTTQSPNGCENMTAVACRVAGLQLLKRLVQAAQSDRELLVTDYFKGSAVHRKKIRIWQAIAALSPFAKLKDSSLSIPIIVEALSRFELASVKQFQETGMMCFRSSVLH
jgi:hypothetical protein